MFAGAYQIETYDRTDRRWTTDGIGDPSANRFSSAEEAEDAIESLRALGGEWAEAEYRVREVA